MLRIEISPAAYRDLRGILRYTQQLWGEPQRRKYLVLIEDATADLASNLQRGRPIELARGTIFRELIGRHYLYFQRSSDLLFVSRILHSAMNFEKHRFPLIQGTKQN